MSTFTDWNGPQGAQAKATDLIALADAYTALVTKLNSHLETSASNNVHSIKDYIDSVKQEISDSIPSISGLLTKLEAQQTYQLASTALTQSDITNALADYATESSVNNKITQALSDNATQSYVENALASYIKSDSLLSHAVIAEMRTAISSLQSWANSKDSTTPSITTANITDFLTAVESAVASSASLSDALSTIDSKIETAVQTERSRAQTTESDLTSRVTALESSTERSDRQTADQAIVATIGNTTSLETNNKNTIVAAINEVNNKVNQQKVTVDTELDENSDNPVQNSTITDAIKYASVKVGSTMLWPSYTVENRITKSSSPFTYTYKGTERSIESIPNGVVNLKISNNIPLGWHAMDGKAELSASDYPELAEYMPNNVTTDGKIWLPYVACTIIKIKY